MTIPSVTADEAALEDELSRPLPAVVAALGALDGDLLILGAPHRDYRGLRVDGRDVVDVWNVLGGGIRL